MTKNIQQFDIIPTNISSQGRLSFNNKYVNVIVPRTRNNLLYG